MAALIGGPQDGEQMLMQPAPGIGPPQHLTYYAKRRPEEESHTYVVDLYEAWPPMACWPDADQENPEAVVKLEYHWQGVFVMTARATDAAGRAGAGGGKAE